jgi:hypothetical protein
MPGANQKKGNEIFNIHRRGDLLRTSPRLWILKTNNFLIGVKIFLELIS